MFLFFFYKCIVFHGVDVSYFKFLWMGILVGLEIVQALSEDVAS